MSTLARHRADESGQACNLRFTICGTFRASLLVSKSNFGREWSGTPKTGMAQTLR
jgi:hypothetical protein